MAEKKPRGALSHNRELKNPDGINTGNPLENTYCPVSRDRLHEMYLKEGKSAPEISEFISRILGRYIHPSQVYRWMSMAEIDIRSKADGIKIAAKKQKYWVKSVQKANDASRISGKHRLATAAIGRQTNKKAHKAYLAACKKQRVLCTCAWCKNTFTRPPSQVDNPERQFCNYSCRGKFGAQQRKFKRLRAPYDAILAQRKQQARELLGEQYPGTQERA